MHLKRGAPATRSRAKRRPRGGSRVHVRARLRPLPSLDRPSGPKPLRLERARWDRACDGVARRRYRRHLPDDPHPPGDRRPGGSDLGGDVAGALLPRRRDGREPERARARRSLAAHRGAPRDARGGRRPDARPLAGRAHEPPRPATSSWRTPVSTRCRTTPSR